MSLSVRQWVSPSVGSSVSLSPTHSRLLLITNYYNYQQLVLTTANYYKILLRIIYYYSRLLIIIYDNNQLNCLLLIPKVLPALTTSYDVLRGIPKYP